jgi:hypothetical protein
MMLTDEQKNVLSKGHKSIYNVHGNSLLAGSKLICKLVGELANALLALKEARAVLKDVEFGRAGYCPSCHYRGQIRTHFTDCKLAANLPEEK